MDATPTIAEYEFLAENVGHFRALLKKLNKRAVKLGLKELVAVIVKRRSKDLKSGGKQWFTTVQVEGESPKLAGWSLAGVIEHTEGGNLLRDGSEGRINMDQYRHSGAHCDHCKTQRKRKETVILENEDGRVTRVGKNCLKDFLGGVSPQQLMWFASWTQEFGALEDEEGMREYGSRGPRVVDLLPFLAYCAFYSRTEGYLSRTAAVNREASATCDSAWSGYWVPKPSEEWRKMGSPMAEARDYDTAKVALEWTVADLLAKAESDKDINDYQHNLQVICNLGCSTGKQAGYAGSILGYYQRGTAWAEENVAKRVQRAAAKEARIKARQVSQHVGIIDKREVFEVIVGTTRELFSDFGCTFLVTFTTLEGSILKWFASSEQDFEAGDQIKIKATIKEHSSWNDTKQTKVNRVKLA